MNGIRCGGDQLCDPENIPKLDISLLLSGLSQASDYEVSLIKNLDFCYIDNNIT